MSVNDTMVSRVHDELLLEFHQLQHAHPEKEAIASNLAYLEKLRAQMHYPQFQAQGWPSGSGIVESGNKLVLKPTPPKPRVDDLILQHLVEHLAHGNEPKKPKNNPWRHFKHGKALYQPSTPPER